MGCDLVVALGPATAHQQTLVGLNLHGHAADWTLRRWPGRIHVLEEKIRLPGAEVTQARQTFTVAGLQEDGAWGLHHGLNEHHVAASCSGWRTKLAGSSPGLTGPDLVRLTLERSKSASQALTTLTDLIAQFGQGVPPRGDEPTDNVFLLADGHEAFVVEAAGAYWASMQCQRVRAVSDAGLIRQDWQRLASGLAGTAIARGWWPDDGSKLDFGAAVGLPQQQQAAALKRWGRASLLLEQQAGHLDLALLRGLLADHCEGQGAGNRPGAGLAASWTVSLGSPEGPALAWWAFGPPGALTLPVFVDGDLPVALDRNGEALYEKLQALQTATERPDGCSLRKALDCVQARIEQEAGEFLAEARDFKTRGEATTLARLAGLFMQNYVELIEAEWRRWRGLPDRVQARTASADVLAYVAE